MSAARRRKKAWTRLLAKGYRARMRARAQAFVDSPEFMSAGESLAVAQAYGDLDGQRAAWRVIVKGTVKTLAQSLATELAAVAIHEWLGLKRAGATPKDRPHVRNVQRARCSGESVVMGRGESGP